MSYGGVGGWPVQAISLSQPIFSFGCFIVDAVVIVGQRISDKVVLVQ